MWYGIGVNGFYLASVLEEKLDRNVHAQPFDINIRQLVERPSIRVVIQLIGCQCSAAKQ